MRELRIISRTIISPASPAPTISARAARSFSCPSIPISGSRMWRL